MEKQHYKTSPRVLLSGGGTGGHIYPAIAIAQEIENRLPHAVILFVGALGKMEMDKVPHSGYKIIGLPIAGFNRTNILSNWKLPFQMMRSWWQSYKIIRSFKPDLAIGTGGYASAPVLTVCQMMGISTYLQEQNAIVGATNKWLSSKAKAVFAAYNSIAKQLPKARIIETGNPIRSNLGKDILPSDAKKIFGLHPDKIVILNLGGSLGASSLNQFWQENYDKLAAEDFQLLWQTGKLDYQDIFNRVGDKVSKNVCVLEFIEDMNPAYAAADIIISRAGAMAISELALIGKPTILVPFPAATHNHQFYNAQALVNKNAAIMVENHQLSSELWSKISALKRNKNRCKVLSENILLMSHPDAAQKIVDVITEFN